jgi:hypothetical protein
MGRGIGTNTLTTRIAEPTNRCNEVNRACWNEPDSMYARVTTGSDQGHGFRNAPTEMAVRLKEIVQVERRILGGSGAQGRSEAFVGGLSENKKQGRG